MSTGILTSKANASSLYFYETNIYYPYKYSDPTSPHYPIYPEVRINVNTSTVMNDGSFFPAVASVVTADANTNYVCVAITPLHTSRYINLSVGINISLRARMDKRWPPIH